MISNGINVKRFQKSKKKKQSNIAQLQQLLSQRNGRLKKMKYKTEQTKFIVLKK